MVLAFVLLYVAMAASLFGAFKMGLPSKYGDALEDHLGSKGGGYGAALLMGLTFGIVAAPCVGPFAATALAYVASTQVKNIYGSLLCSLCIL